MRRFFLRSFPPRRSPLRRCSSGMFHFHLYNLLLKIADLKLSFHFFIILHFCNRGPMWQPDYCLEHSTRSAYAVNLQVKIAANWRSHLIYKDSTEIFLILKCKYYKEKGVFFAKISAGSSRCNLHGYDSLKNLNGRWHFWI